MGPPHFQLVSYDLETGVRTGLSETRSIDDQVEWLDADTIVYALADGESTAQPATELWTLDVTPTSEAQLYIISAESPAVVSW